MKTLKSILKASLPILDFPVCCTALCRMLEWVLWCFNESASVRMALHFLGQSMTEVRHGEMQRTNGWTFSLVAWVTASPSSLEWVELQTLIWSGTSGGQGHTISTTTRSSEGARTVQKPMTEVMRRHHGCRRISWRPTTSVIHLDLLNWGGAGSFPLIHWTACTGWCQLRFSKFSVVKRCSFC